jgi:general L-amino acid transport system substrate-binding protein
MSIKPFSRITLAASAMVLAAFSVSANAATLGNVKSNGELVCGVDGGLPGFSASDDQGRMRGIDADVCYGVAAAIFGDASKVRFVNLTAKERFEALASGEVDLLSRNTTHTLTRDASLGLNFTYYNFIDGQGFLVKKNLGVSSALELDGARICVQSGTTTEANLADYFRTNKLQYEQIAYDTSVATREGFESNYCDVLTSDASQLAAIRSELANPSSTVILPQIISKEPLGPVVRQGDDEFFNLVKWVLYAMINAEELGVDSSNARSMANDADANPSVKRLLGKEGSMCQLISEELSDDCFLNVIALVGNYGEIYEANVGVNTPLGLTRAGSPNDLWSRGGILYAPPLR